MTNRRIFIKNSACLGMSLALPWNPIDAFSQDQKSKPKISLAQWSLNRSIKKSMVRAEDFASTAKGVYGLDAIEFVATYYTKEKGRDSFWIDMLKKSENDGVTNLLIMVDDEGELGSVNDSDRKKAVENHYAWVDAAKLSGCHSIRVNAFGTGERAAVKSALIDGMGKLVEYAEKTGINILIENHGLYSSEADLIVDVIKQVNNPFMGTLPDFGNWCTSKAWGSTRSDDCDTVFDHYKGLQLFLPYAKGVSAKSYDFDDNGNQPRLDYTRFLQIVKDAGFDGYIGIEYEGKNLSEHEGIFATKKLIETVWSSLN